MTDKIRVAYDLRPGQRPGGGRGVGNYVHRLLAALKARQDVEVVPFGWSDQPPPGPGPYVGIPRFGWPRWAWLRDRLCPQLFRKVGQVDLFHFTSPFELDIGWPTGAFETPRLVMVHDLLPLKYRHFILKGRAWLASPILTWMGADLKRAEGLVANSYFTAEEVGDYLKVDVHPAPLAPGKEFQRWEPDRLAELRARLRLPERFFLYVGSLDRRKNVERLLEASAGQAVPLVIAGDVEESRRVELGSRSSRAQWLGYVSEEDLPGLYGAAQALLFPSFYEGFGLPVLEAMACGTPVVCSDIGALREVGGEAAQFCSPDETAEWQEKMDLLSDDRVRSEWSVAGLERAAHFTWEATAEDTVRAYRSLLT